MLPCRMDAARGDRRHHAGRIARQQHAVAAQRQHRSAAGNQAGARRGRHRVVGHVQQMPDAGKKALDVGRTRAAAAAPQRQAHLHAGGRLRGPAEIAGRKTLADEAVQGARLGQGQAVEFVLDAVQELPGAGQAQPRRHARLGAVGADQVAAAADARNAPAVAIAHRLHEGRAEVHRHAMPHQFVGQPAHQRRRIGGQEVVAGRVQPQAAQRRRIEPDLLDAAEAVRRRAAQPGTLGRLLDDDAGGMELRARIALALEHRHAQAGARGRQRAGGAGKTGADDDHVVVGHARCERKDGACGVRSGGGSRAASGSRVGTNSGVGSGIRDGHCGTGWHHAGLLLRR
ncbi:hypothetical protein OJJOAM_000936 [Cupriavidus sp. H18C1]